MTTKTQLESRPVSVKVGPVLLQADLAIPEQAEGIVIFAHGSGSSRFSKRNRAVARTLNDGGLATLLLDLLTMDEQRIDEYTAHLRFDIPLLAERVVGAIDWAGQTDETRRLRIGLFGSSTGAAAAIVAAARRPEAVSAVVSRGGRPDLAREDLPDIKAPTLLIVGGFDSPVIEMNEEAAGLLNVKHKVEIIPGATHLFEEHGKLEQVAELARDWFVQHLAREGAHTEGQ